MAKSFNQLFGHWRDRHRELDLLEDAWEAAKRAGSEDAGVIAERVTALRREVDQCLEQALAAFREDLQRRGLA